MEIVRARYRVRVIYGDIDYENKLIDGGCDEFLAIEAELDT